MRLFIASGIFHPEAGGPATYLHRLLPDLLEAGHEVTALSFGDAPVTGYPYSLTRIPRRNYIRRQWEYRQAAARLWDNHDLAYIHTPGLPLPRNIGPRVGKIVGDIAWERAVNKGWIPPTTDIDRFQTETFSQRAEINKVARAREVKGWDQVIVPSEYLKRMVLGWGVDAERVSVVYNAVETSDEFREESQEEARELLNFSEYPTLLIAARLTAWKGVDHVIEAIARIPDVRLIVAGDGPMRGELEALATSLGVAKRVDFIGRVAHDKLLVYMRAADYLVLYSGYEGLSHVLLEAMSLETPVIASDKGGNPEVVTEGINGFLVPYVDVDALTATIEKAVRPGMRSRLAEGTDLGERFRYGRMLTETLGVLERFGG